MRKLLIFAIIMIMATLISGCSSSSSGLAKLEGEIFWEDGTVLPAGSTVSVQIVNASLADVTETLTQTSFEAKGSPPINFFIEYQESAVDERMTYTATVRIEDPDGTLLYITKTSQPVIVNGEVVDPIRILVEPV